MTRGRISDLALPALGVLLALLILAGLALHVGGADSVGSSGRTELFVGVLAVAAACYLLACAAVLRRPGGRRTVWVVLGVAAVMRLTVLTAPPFLSSDVYRYVWDGRVQQAGFNPYCCIPADPALATLRDAAIYPHVNRADYAPTIYPPAAQILFRAIAAISQTPLAVRIAMVGFEALAVCCLMRLLTLAGLPASRVLIYAWNPLAVWTFAGNGHVDAAAIGLLALALLCRGLRRDGWTGAVLGAAILIKFLPVVVAPALWRPWKWRMPVAAAVVMAALYGCYLSAGAGVFGFLSAYGAEEGLSQGSGIWLLAGLARIIPMPSWAVAAYGAGCVLALGAYASIIALPGAHRIRSDQDILMFCKRAGLLAAAVMLLLSPHYPWYFVFVGVFAVLAPSRGLIWMSVAPLVLYLSPWHESFLWPALIYVPFLVLAALDHRQRETNPTGHPAFIIRSSP